MMKFIHKINWKQTKYILPAILYPLLLIAAGLIIRVFETEVPQKDRGMETTEYLNSNLPDAHLKEGLGSKRENMRHSFGDVSDLSAVQDIANDRDSLKKKEEYDSKYSDEEATALEEQESVKRLREMQTRLHSSSSGGMRMGNDDEWLSDEDRLALEQMRRRRMRWGLPSELDEVRHADTFSDPSDSLSSAVDFDDLPRKKAVEALDDDAEACKVVKKVRETSDYFNTLSEESSESHLIKAIVDEELKAVDGSRVRLRLLDAIEIEGVTLPKGSYLYATLSGFGSQRVKGKIESILVHDELYKIHLSLYDLDGLEGLYVPASSFRQTAKDIASSATQGGSPLNTVSSGNNFAQWAGQALQNAYQQTSNAVSKAIKKNRVRIKYGTQVYLVNGKSSTSGRR